MPNTISPEAVATRNRVNSRAMQAHLEAVALLTPYLGKKVRKTSGYGGWVAKLQPAIDAFRESLKADGFRGWLSCEYRWISVKLDTTYNLCELVGGGHAVEYVKAERPIGKTDDAGTLLELFDLVHLRTDYTVSWVEETRAAAYALECQARELRSSLKDFER